MKRLAEMTCLICVGLAVIAGCEKEQPLQPRSTDEDSFVVDQPESQQGEERHGDAIGAWLTAQQFVTDRLKTPGTTSFGWQLATDCASHLGQGAYFVQGWVDAENLFGAKVRNYFTLKLQWKGADRWQLVEGPFFSGP